MFGLILWGLEVFGGIICCSYCLLVLGRRLGYMNVDNFDGGVILVVFIMLVVGSEDFEV